MMALAKVKIGVKSRKGRGGSNGERVCPASRDL